MDNRKRPNGTLKYKNTISEIQYSFKKINSILDNVDKRINEHDDLAI